ncbi:beta-L-arabinofuranosidase domain-containing protein [Niabella ginsengisoli]|uniref:Glycoside hydrolase family 127 protein n=1 Tax=Niabella ginsengisoli TaxID=522298 RepID=A0ABS9SFX6_9BACT|nr:beta-L-arabinofuranosidase domain-containing protein [Niabella ginsengisoli]MCH5597079.1 glycoside hydrolase family 127 protein [Niabella ginsengisoli]
MKLNIAALLTVLTFSLYGQSPKVITPRAPLKQDIYLELPIGAIKPKGWLREMLIRQKNGATGKLDELYPLVMGKRNGWLGGDGDQWERGPYWIDGLLPLAYILKDKQLIAKVKPWVEWAINSQQPDGYFGPSKDYAPEHGVQRDNSRDWWPKMVMLKILKQYYMATGDQRVITLFTNYFKYQLKELPLKPLDHWTFWARFRAADNLMVVYWLYNITGEHFLLDLANLLHRQTFDFTNAFLHSDLLSSTGSIHGVNLAQGIKSPIIYYQQHQEQKYVDALNKGLADLKKFNGTANGLYGGDEALHGNSPTQGAELCSAVEFMFSLESALQITGDVDYADHLERIAFNALPSQTTDDYMNHQYFQQANQVMITRHNRNFDVNHSGTDICYGLLTGYPCCTSNMHQGWPKFTQNLWYGTPDKGLAALVYTASEVTATVGDNKKVTIKEITNYPFQEEIKFVIEFDKNEKNVLFPLHLRVPKWCKLATVKVNGEIYYQANGGEIIKLNRKWQSGDIVELTLPMHILKNTWHENSVSVERGPIVYALKIGEAEKWIQNQKDPEHYGKSYLEVTPTTAWNFGLNAAPDKEFSNQFTITTQSISNYPWSQKNAPIILKTKGKSIPEWKLYNEMAGPLPYSVIYNEGVPKQKEEEITLIPYGCTKLRISQFPVIGR